MPAGGGHQRVAAPAQPERKGAYGRHRRRVQPSATLLTWNRTTPIQIPYTIPDARTIRLEAARITTAGTTDSASVVSDANGRTTLSYLRVS